MGKKMRMNYSKEMISVHDEILFELFKLDKNSIKDIHYVTIDDEEYLVNKRIVKDKFEIGLSVKVPQELIELNTNKEISGNFFREEKIRKLEAKLFADIHLTYKEMFLLNILLSNYINTGISILSEITFKDIDFIHRKVSVYEKVIVNEVTANSYVDIINSLARKQLFFKSNDKFRNRKNKNYGVNNRDFVQQLLILGDSYSLGSNNLTFKYSFGSFGEVIYRSKRYSNLIPSSCYRHTLIESHKNIIALELGRQLFIARRSRDAWLGIPVKLNGDYFFDTIEGETSKNRKRRRNQFNKNVRDILDKFKDAELIDSHNCDSFEIIDGKDLNIEVYI